MQHSSVLKCCTAPLSTRPLQLRTLLFQVCSSRFHPFTVHRFAEWCAVQPLLPLLQGRLTPEQLANKRAELVEAQRALEASRPGRAQYIPGDGARHSVILLFSAELVELVACAACFRPCPHVAVRSKASLACMHLWCGMAFRFNDVRKAYDGSHCASVVAILAVAEPSRSDWCRTCSEGFAPLGRPRH